MQLVKFKIENYRSIKSTPKLPIQAGLTVLLGPNNEGKSNVLRGFATAMQVLERFRFEHRVEMRRPKRGKPKAVTETPQTSRGRRGYVWERDFPVSLQAEKPNGESVFAMDLQLTDDEVSQFKSEVGSNLNGALPVEIRVGKQESSFRVLKPGRGQNALANKASKISRFISSRLRFQHIEAVRSAEQAQRVVSELVSEQLAVLEANETYTDALATIDTLQEPILQAISESIKTSLAAFLPDVRSVKVAISQQRRSIALRRETEIIVDDGTATPLEHKGDGVQSLAAISLLRHRVAELPGNHDLVIAIEEPESHLHPSAMHGLRAVLQEIATDHQLVISTHSPLFVERSPVAANILVQKQKASVAKSITEIRESLGVKLQDNLQSCEVVLVVEGEEDRAALKPLLSDASQELSNAFAQNRLGIDTLGGGSNLSYKLSQLRLSVCEVHVLVDDDSAGRDALKKALEASLITVARSTVTKCMGMENTELEDWFNRDVYEQHIYDEYGVHLANGRFRGNDAKWSDRLKRTFTDSGKPWNEHIEAKIKSEVAELVSNAGIDAILASRRPAFDSLAESIERLLQ